MMEEFQPSQKRRKSVSRKNEWIKSKVIFFECRFLSIIHTLLL